MYYLITTPTCPECPRAKSFLLEKGENFEIIDGSTKEGLSFARQHEISKVPTLVELDQDKRALKKFHGLSEIMTQFPR